MIFDDFVKKYLGKSVDYDKAHGVQCFDLANQYCKDIVGCCGFSGLYAHMIYNNFNAQPNRSYFTRFANTPEFIPKKGDIAVWSASLNGKAGHVAICTGEGDTQYFYSLDQNWTGNNDPMTKVKHNYNCVLGFLRPKDQTKVNGLPVLDKTGYKQGDKTNGVLALKQMLIIAKTKKLITQSVDNNGSFGSGTLKAVNQLLKYWGYAENGVAGVNFIKRLGNLLK